MSSVPFVGNQGEADARPTTGSTQGKEAAAPATAALSRLENALVSVSHLLVSSNSVDMQEVLGEIAEATNAPQAFLSFTDWQAGRPAEFLPLSSLVIWKRDDHTGGIDIENFLAGNRPPAGKLERLPTLCADGTILTLPLLAEDDRFVGFLGIVQPGDADDVGETRAHVLSVFGDLLSSYLSRTAAEQAMRDSEERSRKLLDRHPDPNLITFQGRLIYANRAAAQLLGVEKDLGTHRMLDFVQADKHAAFEQLRQAQVDGELNEPFEQEIVRLDGHERIAEVVCSAITYQGMDAQMIVLRDVTERKVSEERYRNFVATISEGVFRIDIHGPIPAELPSGEQALRIARFGTVAETNPAMRKMLNLKEDRDLAGINVIAAFPSMPVSLLEAFVAGGYRLENFEFSAYLGAQELRHFSLNAVGRVDRGNLFRIWGSCVDISARVEMERRMVAVLEEEQDRIGRDLHDGVGQLLTGARMLSENLAAQLPAEAGEISNTARKIRDFALEASQRVRDICRGLAPPQLAQEAFGHSLEALCGQLSSVAHTTIHFEWDHDIDTADGEVKVQFYRIAQEALNNALKHSDARNIYVRLQPEAPDRMRLEVRDDGKGFDLTEAQHTSLGLYSMQRRASSVRAQFDIQSTENKGTTVSATYRVDRSQNLMADIASV